MNNERAIEKVVRKFDLDNFSEIEENLAYWLQRTPEERVGAVEVLRKRHHGNAEGLQRVARVTERQCR